MFDLPTTYVPPRSGMTLQDFIAASNTKFELINGERRPKLPAVPLHDDILRGLNEAFCRALETNPHGEIFTETTFILPDVLDANWVTGSRTPDLMFVTNAALSEYRRDRADWQAKPLMLVPDLVVEVVSPEDRASELDEKIDLYLADGVRLVWIIYPERHKVMIYTPDADHPRILRIEDTLEGEDVVPGFRLLLKEIFNA